MANVNAEKMSISDLKVELSNLLKDGFKLRMQKATGQLAQSHLLKQNKKNIARVKTRINETNKDA